MTGGKPANAGRMAPGTHPQGWAASTAATPVDAGEVATMGAGRCDSIVGAHALLVPGQPTTARVNSARERRAMTEQETLALDGIDPSIRQQQMLLDFAVSHSPAIFYIAELESGLPSKFISSNVETITGHSAASFLTIPGYGRRFVHPDDLPGYAQMRHELRQTGSLSHEYRFQTTAGDWLWFRDELRLVGGGSEPEIVGCMIDITQEKAAEAERARLAQRFHDAVESLQNGFSVTDADGRLVACNSALARNFAFEPKALIGKPRRMLVQNTIKHIRRFNGDLVENTEAWLERVSDGILRASQQAVELELKSGRWVLVTGHATSEGGQVTIGTDITRLKEVEAELRQSERYFRSMVEDNPLAVWLVDLDTAEILYASPAVAQLVGRGWPLEGRTLTTDFLVDATEHERQVELLRDRGEGTLNFETRFRRADGDEIWVALNTRLVEYQGRAAGITGIVDLTERKRRENELTQAQEMLEDAIEALSDGFILYDAEDRLVLCNSQYKAFNHLAAELFVPGAKWIDITRERAMRGQFPEALPDVETWLAERAAEHGRQSTEDFPTAEGRWYEHSHRRTRQGGVVITWRDITERREREEALRRAHETLEDAVESLSEGLILYDADDRLVVCNEQYKSFNPDAADLLEPGTPWADIIRARVRRGQFPEAVGNEEAFIAARLAERGKVDGIEFRVTDGRWFEHSHRHTRQGGVVITWREITERRERQEALAHAHETLEDAVESLSEGFALYDADDRLVVCNRRYRAMNRICADIVRPGMLFSDLIWTGFERGEYPVPREQVERWLADYEEVRASAGSILGFEYENSHGRWYSYSSQPTRSDGRVVTVGEITERKKMERALRESEAVVRQILEASPVTLTMARAEDGRILYESPVAEEVFRYDASKGYGTTAERFLDAETRERFLSRLRAEGAVDGVEMEMRRNDGSTVPVALSARLIKYMGEDVTISTVFDLTERTAMETEMARQREIMHQSEKMSALGQLLASVSHELNNPLSVVVGQALLLQETAADKTVAARAERIGAAADRCARIVKTFLAMARQQPTESLAVNANELVEAALEVTAYALRASDVEISLSLARNLPPVMADPDQLTQVFTNLLVNAEQALRDWQTPRKLRITTRLTRQGDELLVKIKDNGPGVPDEIRRRIFDPFFTTKEVGTGTGIGLSLCHRVLEAHSGRIKVETTPGGGATFVVRMPVLLGGDVAAGPQGESAVAGAKLSVLVVDDEPEVAELLRDILRRDGHRVDIAASGQAALGRLRRKRYDVVLSDIRMPGLDGPELYVRLTEDHPELAERIAFITGDTMSPNIKTFLERCGRPYIEKPITPLDVRALVAQVADG
jgi:PAS domain S-box-containing protein